MRENNYEKEKGEEEGIKEMKKGRREECLRGSERYERNRERKMMVRRIDVKGGRKKRGKGGKEV